MAKNDDYKRMKCSFCGKTQDEVRKLIQGPGVYICDECIELCSEIIDEESMEDADATEFTYDQVPKPKEIMDTFNKYVIGQELAKKALAVAVYNHYKRIQSDVDTDDVEIQKSNIIMIGPTGCGKTLLAQTLARILNVPFAIADATSLTEAGYVGEDVENILLRLIQAADYDMDRAEKGIIYLDEIDKIARKSDNPSITRDVSGEGVQQALLKIFEGTVASVPPLGGRKHPQQEFLQLDTSNILFICGGAFDGIEEIIKNRIGKSTMGFGGSLKKSTDSVDLLKDITPQDLLKYGLIPEFVGRVPVIVGLHELDRNALIQILTEPKNSLVKQYQSLLEIDDVKLEIEKEALSAIADKAIQRKTGARGLRAIFEEFMRDVMYELPSRHDVEKCIVTHRTIVNNEMPALVLGKKQKKQNDKKDIG